MHEKAITEEAKARIPSIERFSQTANSSVEEIK
jgi:hypothetical protein